MRKCLCLLLILLLLCPFSASAEEAPCVALTFEGFPGGDMGRLLLAELKLRGIKATFFLRDIAPEDALRIAAGGHELGLLGSPEYFTMSRRRIAGSLRATRELLPQKGKVRLFRPVGECSDGEYQVTRVLGLTVLGWSQDPAAWARQDSAAIGRPPSARLRSGDVIRIRLDAGCSIDGVLGLLTMLREQGFRFVTVSRLAMLQGVSLQPGRAYESLTRKQLSL